MKKLGKLSVVLLTALVAGAPALASAACVGAEDMHALEAASLQQQLMVAALTCHDTEQYNRFVLGHRSELQKSDATLLAYFKHASGGVAAYHAYKTHLANRASLESTRSDGFCDNADAMFANASRGGSLAAVLDQASVDDTGFAACHRAGVRTAQADRTPSAIVAEPRRAAVAVPSRRDERYADNDAVDPRDGRDPRDFSDDRNDRFDRDRNGYRDGDDGDRYADRDGPDDLDERDGLPDRRYAHNRRSYNGPDMSGPDDRDWDDADEDDANDDGPPPPPPPRW